MGLRFSFIAMLLVSGCFILFVNYTAPSVPGKVADMGNVYAGSTKQVSFVIRNDSSVPVKINAVRTSCSCTSVGTIPSEIAANGSVEVTLRVKVPSHRGPFKAIATLDCEKADPIVLTLHGNILLPFPAHIDFGEPSTLAEQEQFVDIQTEDGEHDRVMSAFSGDSSVATIINEGYLSLKWKPRPGQELRAVVNVSTSAHPESRAIAIGGRSRKRAYIADNVSYLGTLFGGRDAAASIRIELPYGDSVDVVSATSDSSAMRIFTSSAKSRGNYLLVPLTIDLSQYSGKRLIKCNVVINLVVNGDEEALMFEAIGQLETEATSRSSSRPAENSP